VHVVMWNSQSNVTENLLSSYCIIHGYEHPGNSFTWATKCCAVALNSFWSSVWKMLQCLPSDKNNFELELRILENLTPDLIKTDFFLPLSNVQGC